MFGFRGCKLLGESRDLKMEKSENCKIVLYILLYWSFQRSRLYSPWCSPDEHTFNMRTKLNIYKKQLCKYRYGTIMYRTGEYQYKSVFFKLFLLFFPFLYWGAYTSAKLFIFTLKKKFCSVTLSFSTYPSYEQFIFCPCWICSKPYCTFAIGLIRICPSPN